MYVAAMSPIYVAADAIEEYVWTPNTNAMVLSMPHPSPIYCNTIACDVVFPRGPTNSSLAATPIKDHPLGRSDRKQKHFCWHAHHMVN